jgi:hypothetical protein
MRSLVTFLMSAALAATLFAARPALAQTAPPPTISIGGSSTSLKGVSLWGILPWGGYGVGGRFMIPLGIRPLLSNTSVRDSFAVEVGGDLLHWSYDYGVPGATFNYSWTEVLAVGGVMWNLWLNDAFALYPKAELGYAFGWFSGADFVGRPAYGGFFLAADAGLLYKLNNGLTLRAEAGSSGLKVGAGWLF